MKIFLTTIIISCFLNSFAQQNQSINEALLATEYSIWNSQDAKEVSDLILLKAKKLSDNGFFKESIDELNRITDFSLVDSNELSYKKSFNNFMLRDFNNAYNIILDIPDSVKLHDKNYLTLWLFILNELNKWSECKKLLLSITDTSGSQKSEIEKLPIGINYKSPSKAKHLSGFFPGAGQFYTGYPLKGAASILLHASFGLIAVESVISGLYVTGVVFGLNPVLRLYLGGKQNSYRLAEANNIKQIQKIKNMYLKNILVSMENYHR
jgi:TM2 domain-containing membrane protein YozV